MVATMISRTVGTPVFSDRAEFSVSTGQGFEPPHVHQLNSRSLQLALPASATFCLRIGFGRLALRQPRVYHCLRQSLYLQRLEVANQICDAHLHNGIVPAAHGGEQRTPHGHLR